MDISSHKIHLTLKALVRMKSKRDGINFTLYQLAKLLNMPHSILSRLIHHHPNKRVNNPRIDTLSKIVEFFKIDGFNITVNDLLMGFEEKSEINIQNQKLGSFPTEVNLPLYSLNTLSSEKEKTILVKLATNSKDTFALLADKDIGPLFKKGSVFIVNKKLKLKTDNLVAVKTKDQPRILVKKLHITSSKIYLNAIDNSTNSILLEPKLHFIMGVIIQINIKT